MHVYYDNFCIINIYIYVCLSSFSPPPLKKQKIKFCLLAVKVTFFAKNLFSPCHKSFQMNLIEIKQLCFYSGSIWKSLFPCSWCEYNFLNPWVYYLQQICDLLNFNVSFSNVNQQNSCLMSWENVFFHSLVWCWGQNSSDLCFSAL